MEFLMSTEREDVLKDVGRCIILAVICVIAAIWVSFGAVWGLIASAIACLLGASSVLHAAARK